MSWLAVTQRGRCLALVDNEVSSHHEVFGADAYLVLIILLIFVQRVILVDILNVRRRLVRRVIAFCTAVAVR